MRRDPTSFSDAPPGADVFREGVVVRSTGSWYDVQADDGTTLAARVRGRFRLEGQDRTNPIAVGDRVTVRTDAGGGALITEIHVRTNQLVRRAAGRRVGQEHIIAANVGAAWIVQSIRLPKINQGLVDRFLVVAESNQIPAGLIFNKTDLLQEQDQEAVGFLRDLYRDLGYPVLMTSAITGEGVDELRERMRDTTNVVTGPSGVGKTALLNRLEPELGLRTGTVSERTQKGKHTTTFAALYPLSFGGFVVDTPGIREFGIMGLDPQHLSHYFVEFRPFLPDCRYPNCTHDHEPDCAVKDAAERGDITPERYDSYLNILESLRLGEKDLGR